MAGLLDMLAQGYGGWPASGAQPQGGGLLDMLRLVQTQQQYQPSAGFPQSEPTQAQPIAVGNYMMPRTGAASLYEPQQAALPPNAQPTQGQMPPQQAPLQQPEEPNRFMTGLQGFIGNLHNGPIGALAGGVGALATGQRTDPGGIKQGQANQTAQALVARGFDPALAKTVASNPDLLKAVLPQVFGLGGQTDDIKEYQFAKKEDPSLTFQKFMQQKKAVSGEYSLTPQYGTNEKGETVMIQPGKSGTAIQTVLPPGVKLSSGVDKIDLGTHWGIIDKKTGNLVGQQAKNIEGKEAAEEVGKARGQAQVALPNVIANAEQTLKIIQDIKNDPYRERGTGFSSILNNVPATGGFDFAQKVEQLKGKAFLEAFQSLKGGGAITEIEGKKAENAIARLNVAQSEGSFLQALNDLEEVVTAGIGRAKARAGQPGAAATPAPSGQPGVVDYRTYFGGKK